MALGDLLSEQSTLHTHSHQNLFQCDVKIDSLQIDRQSSQIFYSHLVISLA